MNVLEDGLKPAGIGEPRVAQTVLSRIRKICRTLVAFSKRAGSSLEGKLGYSLLAKADVALLLLLLMTATYVFVFSLVSVQRYDAFQSSLDLGSTTHQLYAILMGWEPWWIELTHLFSVFSYVLLLPFSAFPGPRTLLVAQTIIIGGAAIPVYFLTLRFSAKRWVGLAVSLAYLLNPITQAVNWFDIHTEGLALPFIFAFFYYWESGRPKRALVFFLLGLSTSYTVALGLVAWSAAEVFRLTMRRRSLDRKLGNLPNKVPLKFALGLLLLSVGWELLALTAQIVLTDPTSRITGASAYELSWPGVGNGPVEIFLAPVMHPSAFLSNLGFQYDLKVWYLVVVLGLFGFLPLLDRWSLVGTAPWLFLALSSRNSPLYTLPYYQYSAIILPYLLVGFLRASHRALPQRILWWTIALCLGAVLLPFAVAPVFNLRGYEFLATLLVLIPVISILSKHRKPEVRPILNVVEKRFRSQVVTTYLIVTALLFSLYAPLGPLASYATAYELPRVSGRDVFAEKVIELIHSGASVLVQNNLYPHLWNLRYVSVHDETTGEPDYILADLGEPPENGLGNFPPFYYVAPVPPFPPISETIMENLSRGTYGVIAETHGFLLLKKGYSGPPAMYTAASGIVSPCILSVPASSNMTCVNGELIQTSNQAGTSTLWYGPYMTLAPGTYTASVQIALNRSISTDFLTLLVTSYLPSNTPILTTLASLILSGNQLSAPGRWTNVSLSFNVTYPALIQFVGLNEIPNVLVNLHAITFVQTSPVARP